MLSKIWRQISSIRFWKGRELFRGMKSVLKRDKGMDDHFNVDESLKTDVRVIAETQQ